MLKSVAHVLLYVYCLRSLKNCAARGQGVWTSMDPPDNKNYDMRTVRGYEQPKYTLGFR